MVFLRFCTLLFLKDGVFLTSDSFEIAVGTLKPLRIDLSRFSRLAVLTFHAAMGAWEGFTNVFILGFGVFLVGA